MDDKYYEKILNEAIGKATALSATRDCIEVELTKLNELIQATANMLSDEVRDKYLKLLNDAVQRNGIRDASLIGAIRALLQESRGQYFTVSQVRDRLKSSGFDFTSYMSNPLASISTTLRRMSTGSVVETIEVQGVAAYRWNRKPVGFPSGKKTVKLSDMM